MVDPLGRQAVSLDYREMLPSGAKKSCWHQTHCMQGRVKRKLGLREVEERTARAEGAELPVCALCRRMLGSRIEWHHRVPKSEGGTETVPVHPICHRAIHAHVQNQELAAEYADLDTLRARADMQRFLRWIVRKPIDFHAPTRRSQAGRDKGV